MYNLWKWSIAVIGIHRHSHRQLVQHLSPAMLVVQLRTRNASLKVIIPAEAFLSTMFRLIISLVLLSTACAFSPVGRTAGRRTSSIKADDQVQLFAFFVDKWMWVEAMSGTDCRLGEQIRMEQSRKEKRRAVN